MPDSGSGQSNQLECVGRLGWLNQWNRSNQLECVGRLGWLEHCSRSHYWERMGRLGWLEHCSRSHYAVWCKQLNRHYVYEGSG